MVGKKKTNDIQFYRDVLDNMVEETGGARRKVNFGDEDELEEEEAERERKKQSDIEFKSFCELISQSAHNVSVETPNRSKGFSGIVAKQNVFLQPTPESLVYLSEQPYLTVAWDDVEVAYLERVLVFLVFLVRFKKL